MVNWCNDLPAFADTPTTTLLHGLLSLCDRPEHARRARPARRMSARRLRARAMHKLNRYWLIFQMRSGSPRGNGSGVSQAGVLRCASWS